MEIGDIHNYYELLVIDELARLQQAGELQARSEMLEDIVCLALNSLPARYIRSHVDLSLHLENSERQSMTHAVRQAIQQAIIKVHKNPRERED